MACGMLAASTAQAQWAFGGGNLQNSRSNSDSSINSDNAKHLRLKWAFTTHGDISATPTVDGDDVYAVDWGGYIYRINKKTGAAKWSHVINDYTGNPGNLISAAYSPVVSLSRTSPAVDDDKVIFGDQGYLDKNGVGIMGLPQGTGTASVMAVDKGDGHLLWRTAVETHWEAAITSSPVIHDGKVYVGVCSLEEGVGELPFPYPFSYKGSVVCLDEKTGALLWRTYTITNNASGINSLGLPQGYAGAAVWGSTPVVDEERGSLYVATGNNYAVPDGSPEQVSGVLSAGNHIDSVLALDLKTGALKWAISPRKVADTWNAGNLIGSINAITNNTGPDYDFGSGPNMYSTEIDGRHRDIIGAGEKSGQYWAINAEDGKVLWSTQVGPGGTAGGIEWGSATDGKRIYCAVSNSNFVPYTGLDGATHNAGLWAALDAKTGKYLWQLPDPNNATDYGMVSVVNGVMLAGSMSGTYYAIDGSTGKVLWSYQTTGAINCGAAVDEDSIYWGSGYSHFGFGKAGNTLFAFTVKDRD